MVETKVLQSDIPFTVVQESILRVMVKLPDGKTYETRPALTPVRVDLIDDEPRIQVGVVLTWSELVEVTHGT